MSMKLKGVVELYTAAHIVQETPCDAVYIVTFLLSEGLIEAAQNSRLKSRGNDLKNVVVYEVRKESAHRPTFEV